MSEISKIGIIIQARMGSTRLPNKMGRVFYEGKSLSEEIFLNFCIQTYKESVIVATSANVNDDYIENKCDLLKLKCFRGSESDVLQRFIDAASNFNLDVVIRVCADNPFIQIEYIQKLISEYENGKADYISFNFPDGTPVIKSHIGLFAELVTVKALQKVNNLTSDLFYHEHVTNFIYEHPDLFKLKFLPVPNEVINRRDIRLTIDTQTDFDNMRELYSNWKKLNQTFSIQNLINLIDENPELLKSMQNEINRNSK